MAILQSEKKINDEEKSVKRIFFCCFLRNTIFLKVKYKNSFSS